MLKDAKSNVLTILQSRYSENKNKIAIGTKENYGWIEYTYEGLSLLSKSIAAYLLKDLEIKQNENIAIISKSRIEFLAVFFASIITGATLIPINPNQELYNIQRYIKKYNIKYIFTSEDNLEKSKQLETFYEDIKVILLNDIKNKNYISIYDLNYQENIRYKHRYLNSNAIISTTDPILEEKTNFKNLIYQINNFEHDIKNKFKIKKYTNILSLTSNDDYEGLIFNTTAFLNLGWSIYCLDDLEDSINIKEIYDTIKDKKIKYIYTSIKYATILQKAILKDLNHINLIEKLIFNIKYYTIANLIPLRTVRKLMFEKLFSKTGLSLKGIIIYNNSNKSARKIKHAYRKLGLRACIKQRDFN